MGNDKMQQDEIEKHIEYLATDYSKQDMDKDNTHEMQQFMANQMQEIRVQ